jgi:hypothetical protein
LALGDDALIDTYHQAWEDHRDARGEGSDNLSKACAKSRATEKAMRDRFPDYQSRYKQRYPLTSSSSIPERPYSPPSQQSLASGRESVSSSLFAAQHPHPKMRRT